MFKSIPITFLLLVFSLVSCQTKDHDKLIGKWENEQDWFEYFSDSTYNSGKAMITMVKGFKYNLDEKDHALTMYTDKDNQTFYLHYDFIGNDTLAIYNKLSSNQSPVKFYKVHKP